jgi:hypothetical protein
MRDMNGGAQVRLPQGGWHNDEFVSLIAMSQSGQEETVASFAHSGRSITLLLGCV